MTAAVRTHGTQCEPWPGNEEAGGEQKPPPRSRVRAPSARGWPLRRGLWLSLCPLGVLVVLLLADTLLRRAAGAERRRLLCLQSTCAQKWNSPLTVVFFSRAFVGHGHGGDSRTGWLSALGKQGTQAEWVSAVRDHLAWALVAFHATFHRHMHMRAVRAVSVCLAVAREAQTQRG
jgi:hypothetical protein